VIFNREDAYAEMRVTGRPSLEERDRAIDGLLDKPWFGPTTPILVDGRQVETLPDKEMLIAFAQHHARRLPGHRLAYLMNAGVGYGVAREIGTYIELKGVEVESFVDEDEARDWLLRVR
jgi:hypothetical protein